jgi:hypothetical protein
LRAGCGRSSGGDVPGKYRIGFQVIIAAMGL